MDVQEAGGGLNHKPGPKNCREESTMGGKTEKNWAEELGKSKGIVASVQFTAGRLSQPSAGEKCCNSEAPTVAR